MRYVKRSLLYLGLLLFLLTNISLAELTPPTHAVTFDVNTQIVHFPALTLDDTSYQFDLRLVTEDSTSLTLVAEMQPAALTLPPSDIAPYYDVTTQQVEIPALYLLDADGQWQVFTSSLSLVSESEPMRFALLRLEPVPVFPGLETVAVSDTSVDLQWYSAVSTTSDTSIQYEVHIDNTPDFIPSNKTLQASVVDATRYQLVDLVDTTDFYVLVIAEDGAGQRSVERNYHYVNLADKTCIGDATGCVAVTASDTTTQHDTALSSITTAPLRQVAFGKNMASDTRSADAENSTGQLRSKQIGSPQPVTGEMSGYTPLQCDANEYGAAVCSLSITTPSGTGGMAPNLSLNYNSQGGNGLLGLGWSLGGLAAITRCPPTLTTNGFADGVDFDANDRFCLNGEQLRAVNGEYGADQTVYFTDQHSFQKIVSYGTAASGPAYFKLWDKAGLIMEFGKTTNARIEAQGRQDVLVWALNKVTDTKGNYFQVRYTENNANGEYMPQRIDYTGNANAGLLPYASVLFDYEARPDVVPMYIGGALVKMTQRLIGIRTRIGAQVMRQYQLQYDDAGLVPQSRLVSVQECGTDGSCFAPSQFGWLNSNEESFNQTTLQTTAYGLDTGWNNENVTPRHLVDVNGDGLADMVGFGADGVYVTLSTGNGFGSVTKWTNAYGSIHWNNENVTPRHLVDVNSDGLVDILGFAADGVYVSLSTGNSFAAPTKWSNQYGSSQGWTDENVTPRRLADVNGDNLIDIVGFSAFGVIVALSTGSHFSSPLFWSSQYTSLQGWTDENVTPRHLVDVNGDGFADIVGFAATHAFVSLSTGSNFTAMQAWSGAYPSLFWKNENATPRHLVDVNGDGLADIVGFAATDVIVALSTGNGFTAATSWSNAYPSTVWQNENATPRRLADVNGDGFIDIVGFAVGGVIVALSTGNHFITPKIWTNEYGSEHWKDENVAPRRLADINGDGFPDIVGFAAGGVLTATSKITSPTLISSITNGHEKNFVFQYKTLADTDVYTKPTGAQYPVVDFISSSFQVVAKLSVDNALGGQRNIRYSYKNGRLDARGRGFLGFHVVTQADELTGVQRTTYYKFNLNLDYRSANIRQTETHLANGTLIESSINDITLQNYGNGVKWSKVDKNVSRSYALDGSLVSTTTTTTQYDNCGNPTQIHVDTHDGREETSNKLYHNGTDCQQVNANTPWLLGRLYQAEVTHSVVGQGSTTRTSEWQYDAQSGLLTLEAIEPGNALCVQKAYQHDVYGNIVSSTTQNCAATQPRIQPHSQYSEYNASGRFLVSSFNALGHVERKAYDVFGNQTSLTDANGVTTYWQYDGFGRPTLETRADNTWTQTAYRRNSTGSPCPSQAYYYTQTQVVGGNISYQCFDKLDREVRQATFGFNGQLIFVDTQYNARGEIVQKSEPYFSTDTPLWTTLAYDILGRPLSQTTPNGSVTRVEYQGLTTTTINALGQNKTEVSDVHGNVIRSVDHLGHAVTYLYDGFNNLLDMRDTLGNHTQMFYDLRGNKTRMLDPDTGETHYSYDALGKLLSQTDANNHTAHFSYDVLGRMVSRTEPEGTSQWTYDTAANGIGKLASVDGIEGYQRRLEYDTLGRPVRTYLQINGNIWASMRTLYDEYGRVKTLVYPTSYAVQHQYNQYGYLTAVIQVDNSAIIWQAEAMNARQQLEKQRFGNGLITNTQYDNLTGYTRSIQTAGVHNLTYEFDVLGNLKRRGQDGILSEWFSYDSLNRLVRSEVLGGQILTMNYDSLGNITYKSGVGSYNYGQSSTGVHAVTQAGGVDYTYDAVGNRIATSYGQQVTYSSFNKPTLITQGNTSLQFKYAPDRSRYQQVIVRDGETTDMLYFDKFYEREKTATGVTQKHYIFAGGEQAVAVHIRDSAGKSMQYLHRDHLGSITSMTDETGAVVEKLSFDAWGQRRTTEWGVLTEEEMHELARNLKVRYGFTGHEHLDEVNLVHMNGRVYDPMLGRFLSADPIVQEPTNLQNLNRYSYVLNNPLSYTDPSGFFINKIFKEIKRFVKKVVKFIKKVWRTVVSTVIGAVVGVLTFGVGTAIGLTAGVASVLAGAAVSFTTSFTSTLLHGGSIGDALKAGLKNGLINGVTAGLTKFTNFVFNALTPLIKTTAAQFVIKAAKLTAHGVISGVNSVLHGGSFGKAFLKSMGKGVLDFMSFTYQYMTGQKPELFGMGKVANKSKGYWDPPSSGFLNVGMQGARNQGKLLAEGSPLTTFIGRYVPFVNAISSAHDYMQVTWTGHSETMRTLLNVPYMVPATVLTIGAYLAK